MFLRVVHKSETQTHTILGEFLMDRPGNTLWTKISCSRQHLCHHRQSDVATTVCSNGAATLRDRGETSVRVCLQTTMMMAVLPLLLIILLHGRPCLYYYCTQKQHTNTYHLRRILDGSPWKLVVDEDQLYQTALMSSESVGCRHEGVFGEG